MSKFFLGFVAGLVGSRLLGLASLWLGVWPFCATAEPPGWERVILGMAVSNSVAREAPKQQDPIPATAENLVAGMKLYKRILAGAATVCPQSPATGAPRAFTPEFLSLLWKHPESPTGSYSGL